MASSSKVVIALNGFLGRKADWNLIPNLLPAGWDFHAVDPLQSQVLDFDQWSKNFVSDVESKFGKSAKKVLLGYSMGGRLALHALIRSPPTFEGAMIVSANPGLQSEEEKRARIAADVAWAGKLTQTPWAHLMNEWNQQSVFQTSVHLPSDAITLSRKESDFNRQVLANALTTWSLGKQRDLRVEIGNVGLPIEFVTGQFDLKFSALMSDVVALTAKAPREHLVISGAGHRVPWDTPSRFRVALANFLGRW